MTEADLQKIISILEGPLPGKMATCKQILDHCVHYHKCAGSLLDEVLRLREAIEKHKRRCFAKGESFFLAASSPEIAEFHGKVCDELWEALGSQ